MAQSQALRALKRQVHELLMEYHAAAQRGAVSEALKRQLYPKVYDLMGQVAALVVNQYNGVAAPWMRGQTNLTAPEIVQNAFIARGRDGRFTKLLLEWDPSRGKFHTFANTLLRHLYMDWLRSNRPQPWPADVDQDTLEDEVVNRILDPDADEDPAELAERVITADRIKAVLDSLPSQLRAAWISRARGEELQAIAEEQGVSVSEVKRRISTVKERLRKELDFQ
jgi:RNA polymerase sigma factor (sigma-70 family)